jgi:hypothetical protein
VLVFAIVVLALVGSLRPQPAGPSASAGSGPGIVLLPSSGVATPTVSDSLVGEASPSSGPVPTQSPAPRTPKPTSRPTPRPTARPTTRPTTRPSACTPTDQDRYVYNPSRLAVQAACIRVTGTVEAIRHEADGDLHILLALYPAYAHLLRPANQGEELGDLVVEPVCVRSVSQTDAIALCRSDPDPFPGPFPFVGEAIWMEGRYVFDLEHGGWAELHPLYRWGVR